MMSTLSLNTQSILLLTAPLIVGRGGKSPDLLTPGQYKTLVRHLREIGQQPADLISSDNDEVLRNCSKVIEEARLRRLLGRGLLLGQAIERWQARSFWVISRADPNYPRRLKARLRENAPAVLYGCGDINLLNSGGLAVVGSRHVNEALIDYTISVGELAARAGKTLVSGGAKGIDQAAMRGAMEAGGYVVGVLADSLERKSMVREYRNMLRDGQLTLISPYDPNAGFNVGNAMQRNKLIYALADASLVVSSDVSKGGTWSGAVEQLDKLRFVSVYVRSTGETSAGLDALREKGAEPWPNPHDANTLETILNAPALKPVASAQAGLPLGSDGPSGTTPIASASCEDVAVTQSVNEPPIPASDARHLKGEYVSSKDSPSKNSAPNSGSMPQIAEVKEAPTSELSPAEVLFAAVRISVQQLLSAPMKDAEFAAALDVSNAQAKIWLQRLVDEGVIEKNKRPVRYVVKQSNLFG